MPKRNTIITLRVTKAEKVILDEAANIEGCSLNEYIHRRILNSAKDYFQAKTSLLLSAEETSKLSLGPNLVFVEQAEPGNYDKYGNNPNY